MLPVERQRVMLAHDLVFVKTHKKKLMNEKFPAYFSMACIYEFDRFSSKLLGTFGVVNRNHGRRLSSSIAPQR